MRYTATNDDGVKVEAEFTVNSTSVKVTGELPDRLTVSDGYVATANWGFDFGQFRLMLGDGQTFQLGGWSVRVET